MPPAASACPTPTCPPSRDPPRHRLAIRAPSTSRCPGRCRGGRHPRSPVRPPADGGRRSTLSTRRRRRRGRGVAVGAGARRPVEVPPRRRPGPRHAARRRRRHAPWRLERAHRPRRLGAPRVTDTPAYLNVRMPFEGQAPAVPAANPTGVHRRTFTVPAGVATAVAFCCRVGAANSMGFVWVNGTFVGARHGQPSRLDLRRHRRRPATARTRCASSCRSGARRRGWRTRTSGGSPACTAASRWWPVPRVALADTATVPGLEPDGTTGTLDLDVECRRRRSRGDRPRSQRAVHRRGQRARSDVTASRAACEHHRRSRCRPGPSAIRATPTAAPRSSTS